MRIRFIVVSALLLLAASSTALAASPEEVVLGFFEATQAGDWEEAVRYMDPEALASLQDGMMRLLESDPSGEFLSFVFGDDVTLEDVRAVSPAELLVWVIDSLGFADQPDLTAHDRLEILGSVPEGDDIVHVVARRWMDPQGASSVEVISVVRRASGWYVDSGELTGGLLGLLEFMFTIEQGTFPFERMMEDLLDFEEWSDTGDVLHVGGLADPRLHPVCRVPAVPGRGD